MRVEILPLRDAFRKSAQLWPLHRMSDQAAGYDLVAAIEGRNILEPGARALIPCGFAVAIPPGFEGQVRPRSGLAHRHGITVLNTPGTIDADYRGEVKVLLINLGNEAFVIRSGMRIAQIVFCPVQVVELSIVDHLSSTDRGAGGFGSTDCGAPSDCNDEM